MTSTPDQLARRLRAATEAGAWVQRMESGDLSASERGEFVDWLRESPLHVAEALRVSRLAAALARLGDWSQVAPAQDLGEPIVVQIGAPIRSQTTPIRSHRRTWLAASAAALVLVSVVAVLWYQRLPTLSLQTRSDERREVKLADGSVVRLSPNTQLRVALRPELRTVLLERGEAMFRVAKDSARPFVVNAAHTRVQAVGTVFAVARSADAVVVTVTEGRVAVTPLDDAKPIALQANERLAISSVGIPSEVRRIGAPRTPEWSDNQLIFENARVLDVVNRFNSHNQLQIRITDSALGARSISGIFDVDDPRSFVDFLTTVTGASSTELGRDEIAVLPAR